jgi:microsomal epoxide hydrolase
VADGNRARKGGGSGGHEQHFWKSESGDCSDRRTHRPLDGDVESAFSKDELLTNITLYWVTETITSSSRLYYESGNTPATRPVAYVDVPTGVAIFPKEILFTPRQWAEASFNIVRWTVMPRGGHFAALEEPDLFVKDIRSFFGDLR